MSEDDYVNELVFDLSELEAENARLRRQVERLTGLIRLSNGRDPRRAIDSDVLQQLDAILADEPGEGE